MSCTSSSDGRAARQFNICSTATVFGEESIGIGRRIYYQDYYVIIIRATGNN